MSMTTLSPAAGLPFDRRQLGKVAPHAVELGLDVLFRDNRARNCDLEGLVADQLELGPDLDHGVEGQGALVLAPGDLDLGLVDDVDGRFRSPPGRTSTRCVLRAPRWRTAGAPDPRLQHPAGRPCPAGSRELSSSLANLANVSSMAFSTSASSTSTESLTLLPSSGATWAFI